MVKIYILIEQAVGYGLLKVNKAKSTDDLLNMLNKRNINELTSDFQLVEFQHFISPDNAAMNCVEIANGVVSEDLSRLLKKHLTEGKSILVVNDKKLLESLKSLALNDELTFTADKNLVFNMREIRHNFHLFLNDSEEHLIKAHIGLGHGYSKIKVKYNVNRSDNMIIQTINLLDQMDKDINTMTMRLREWFGYHYPELFKIVPDYKSYAKVAQLIKSRAGAVQENYEKLEGILQDSYKAQMIIDSAKSSMGFELTDEDFINITVFADKILHMIDQREFTVKYLSKKMSQVAPNFSTLVGDVVAARLISHAGSLINLAKFPASTIQILGAEKALFRAIKTRSNTPKYGLIFHSSFIGRAAKGDKGRVSRFLAAKISLAVRLDCFMDEPINIYGKHLKKHVEDQLVYLETGKEPRKNFEMMEEAVKEANIEINNMKLSAATKAEMVEPVEVKSEKKVKKEKKRKSKTGEVKEETVEMPIEPVAVETVKKEKKKSLVPEVKEEQNETKTEEVVVETDRKKKKKKKNVEATEELKEQDVEMRAANELQAVEQSDAANEGEKKKKKKRKTAECEAVANHTPVDTAVETVVPDSSEPAKKKKKNKQ